MATSILYLRSNWPVLQWSANPFDTFFCLFNAKTRYGHLDTAKSLDNSLWGLSRSWSPKLWNVSEMEYIQPKHQAGMESEFKISDSVHLWPVAFERNGDLKPSRPRLTKMGTETMSRGSILIISLWDCKIDYLIMGLCVHRRALICKYVSLFFITFSFQWLFMIVLKSVLQGW